MKKLFSILTPYLFLLVLLNYSCKSITPEKSENINVINAIDSLIKHKNFFAARDLFILHHNKLSSFDRLKTGVFLDHAFNQSNSSAQKAEELYSGYDKQISDSLKYKIEAIAHINFSRIYEYRLAYLSLQNLLQDYDHFMTEAEKKNNKNTLLIWEALQDQPKQHIEKNQALEASIIRDKAGLQNLQVTSGNAERNFIFDTGANISTITETTAEEFGVTILDGSFDVNAITGDKIRSRIGIAPEMNIGSVIIKNAIFLVFPDDALAFPQIDFQINGILGFPVLEALNEIHITRDDRFIVPLKQTTAEKQNLALDFLTPLLNLENENGAGVYTFDTGANKTMLYNTYLIQHKQEFDGAQQEVDYIFGGAGGVTTKKGFYTTFRPIINEKIISIDSVIVLIEPVTDTNLFYGNLGQDLINQFDKMIINFDQMFLRFK